MKKIFCLLIASVMLLCACSSNSSGDVTISTTEAPTAAETTAPAVPETTEASSLQLPISAISMPVHRTEVKAEDGTLLFTQLQQDVSLVAPDAATAEKVVLSLLQHMDRLQATGAAIREQAEADYAAGFTNFPYFYELSYNPMRLDEKVLSLYGAEMTYTGGSHGNNIGLSLTVDMVTGEALSLGDVLIDNSSAASLAQLIISDLTVHKDEYQLFDGFASSVNSRFGNGSGSWADEPAWYLSADGLCVYFSPYDIAPYVSGTIQVEIPYENLDGILIPDFIPPQLPEGAGTVSTVLAQDTDLDQYTQFAEVILHPDGERFILYSDDLVTNVTLEAGSWDQDGVRFTPAHTVFACSTLCRGDAVMVQEQFPDAMPPLRLTYRSGGEEFSFFLTQSGEDASILLVQP